MNLPDNILEQIRQIKDNGNKYKFPRQSIVQQKHAAKYNWLQNPMYGFLQSQQLQQNPFAQVQQNPAYGINLPPLEKFINYQQSRAYNNPNMSNQQLNPNLSVNEIDESRLQPLPPNDKFGELRRVENVDGTVYQNTNYDPTAPVMSEAMYNALNGKPKDYYPEDLPMIYRNDKIDEALEYERNNKTKQQLKEHIKERQKLREADKQANITQRENSDGTYDYLNDDGTYNREAYGDAFMWMIKNKKYDDVYKIMPGIDSKPNAIKNKKVIAAFAEELGKRINEWEDVIDPRFIQDILYLETRYNLGFGNKKSAYVSGYQMYEKTVKTLYGATKGAEIYKKFKNGELTDEEKGKVNADYQIYSANKIRGLLEARGEGGRKATWGEQLMYQFAPSEAFHKNRDKRKVTETAWNNIYRFINEGREYEDGKFYRIDKEYKDLFHENMTVQEAIDALDAYYKGSVEQMNYYENRNKK